MSVVNDNTNHDVITEFRAKVSAKNFASSGRIASIARWVTAWILLVFIGLWLSWQVAVVSAIGGLQQQLDSQLLPQLVSTDGRRLDQYSSDESLLEQINRDLALVPVTSQLPVIRQCSAKLDNLHGEVSESDPDLSLTSPDGHYVFDFQVDCQPDYVGWISVQGLLMGFLLVAVWLLPKPLSEQENGWLDLLREQQPELNPMQVRVLIQRLEQLESANQELAKRLMTLLPQPVEHWLALVESLNSVTANELVEGQWKWLKFALTRCTGNVQNALEIARAEPRLTFDLECKQLSIHGLPVELPITPFLYYLWYARLRKFDSSTESGGWLLNPPTNRPDTTQGEALADLMEELGGHGRAINDLRAQGLKAKSLDQNRGRIKDELTRQLGEELVTPYLFDSERDPASGRLKHRIALPAGQIEVLNASNRSY